MRRGGGGCLFMRSGGEGGAVVVHEARRGRAVVVHEAQRGGRAFVLICARGVCVGLMLFSMHDARQAIYMGMQ